MATFYIEQFGCRATQADGAAIERQLLDRGCTLADSACSADVVVLNTCTVTAAADAQARDAIRKLHANNPAIRLVVTGCYAQRAPEELASLPGVSHVVGNSHKPQIAGLVAPSLGDTHSGKRSGEGFSPARSDGFIPTEALFAGSVERAQYISPRLAANSTQSRSEFSFHLSKSASVLVGDILDQHDVLVAPVLGGESGHTRPTLKIQDGCNNRCAFCVIPLVRGKSRSLPPTTVIEEIRRLSGSGYKEIVLSGINLGAWGRDLSPQHDFLDLLKRILDDTDVARLRLSSVEPLDVTRDLILLFASTPRLAEHFHMPLQSGADKMLAAMHRWYRTEHYARRVELVREHLPNAAIGADIITGFPAETEEDHAATLKFIEERPFTYLHVFSYSSRPGTRAASLCGHVAPNIIKRRARELRSLSESKSAAFFRSQSGRSLSVLTLRHSDSTFHSTVDWTPALSSNYLKLRLPGRHEPNQFLTAVCPSAPQELAETNAAHTFVP